MPKISLLKSTRLITTVKSYPGLYDPGRREYGDVDAKSKVWNEVAAKCGIKTGYEAKMMFKNLRDCYRICRNKLNANPNAKVWKFYPLMEFLGPYIKDRKLRRRTQALAAEPELRKTGSAGNPAKPTQTPILDDDDIVSLPSDNEVEAGGARGYESDEPPCTCNPHDQFVHELQTQTNNGRPFDLDTKTESALDSDEDILEEIKPTTVIKSIAINSLRSFFDAMYASTSDLPEHVQRRIKKAIFLAVLKSEEETGGA